VVDLTKNLPAETLIVQKPEAAGEERSSS